MAVLTTINSVIDWIPKLILLIREGLTKLLLTFNVPYDLAAGIIALGLAYLYLKQWIMPSVFLKISSLINYILLALVIFLVLTRIG